MEFFDLAILFTAPGAVVGAALVKTLVSAGKAWGLVPEHGRGTLYAVAVLSAMLIALATWGAEFVMDGIAAQDLLMILLAWSALYAASVGVHETAVKVQRIASGTTNPVAPDESRAG